MAELEIPNRFLDAQAISVSDIDENFSAVATLLNTTKLGADNFRNLAGITNAQKSSPYSIVPIVVCIPKLELTPTTEADAEVTYSGLWAYPSYHQGKYDEIAGAPEGVSLGSKLPVYPFEIQGSYHGAANVHASDVVTAEVWGRKESDSTDSKIMEVSGGLSENGEGSGTPVASFPAAFAYLKIHLKAVKDSALKRTFNNIFVTIWCKMPHVAAVR